MPDYLSPGVYIEELPPQLRAIEGVSTSTAGFVGAAARGAVPGSPLPFTPLATDPQVVTLVPTPTPVLVTSFADFVHQFGNPLPLPDPTGTNYLGYAVMGFFNNGGQILYIARAAPSDASYGSLRIGQGDVLRLSADAVASDPTLSFAALRGVSNNVTLAFFHHDGTAVVNAGTPVTATVQSYDAQATPPTVTLTGPIGVPLPASDVYVTIGTFATTGPTFWARNQGSWSSQISVTVTPSRRRAVPVATAAVSTATQIQVASTSGFYQGAIIEIDTGSRQIYNVVASIAAGGILVLNSAVGTALTTAANVRIVEIDITIVDPSLAVPITETFAQLTWNPDANPAVRPRHYSTVINAQSSLVYVQPPGVAGASGSETATLASQPMTFSGQAVNINGVTAAFSGLTAVLQAVGPACTALGTAVTGLIAGPLPATTTSPALVAVNTAVTALQNALQALPSASAIGAGGPVTTLTATVTAIAAAGAAAIAAGTAAVTTAQTNPTTPAVLTQLTADETAITTQLTAITNALGAMPASAAIAQPGSDGSAAIDYVGVDNGPGQRSAIQSLKDAESVSIIAAPGQTAQVVQDELINQCELSRYRFAVLDGEQDPAGGSVNAILTHRDQYDTSYAAYYVPWLQLTLSNQAVFVPPAGHVAGIYAGTDINRGVWKAPANVVVQSITGLKTSIVKGEQDILNPAGVNAIRRFDTLGTRVWGARTLSSDSSLIYVNVRRTLIFLEASIDQGTQWVVFEPNTQDTWSRLTDSVSAFLTTQWANGALFGAKPSDSFFVRCDETTMTADDIQNGRLICLIGVAIVRPAEFVIFRIEQITGYANQ